MFIFFSSGGFYFYQHGKVEEKESETSKLDWTAVAGFLLTPLFVSFDVGKLKIAECTEDSAGQFQRTLERYCLVALARDLQMLQIF